MTNVMLDNPEEIVSTSEQLLIDSIEQRLHKNEAVPKEDIQKLITLTKALKVSIGYYRDSLFEEYPD